MAILVAGGLVIALTWTDGLQAAEPTETTVTVAPTTSEPPPVTSVPETSVPETSVPGTSVPVTTSVPGTSVPAASPPTTTTPSDVQAPVSSTGPLPDGGTFWDDDGNVHEPLIEAIAALGITRGCSSVETDLYCPSRQLTRGEMAAFLVRTLRLPPGATDHFVDDDASLFEADINALAEVRITQGCAPDRFCPERPVTRAQMAAFLVRAFDYTDRPAGNVFGDDDGSLFEADIERLAAARVTLGCNPPANDRFCPSRPVSRDQMASFLGRALDLEPIEVGPRPSRSIVVTGDTLIHTPIAYRAARYAEGSDDYDFRPMFAPVRPFISGADVAICHLEVPLSGRIRGVSGYPRFSSPPELAAALAWAGYDGCSTASNHSVDQGLPGLVATIDALEDAGLNQAGMARNAGERSRIAMYDAGGVTVANLSATYALNGIPLPAPWAVELIDVDRLLAQAKAAKAQGADFVVVSIHCCIEYVHEPTAEQTRIHRTLIASPNVDLVVGHHAHVVQPIDFVDGEYIVYGLGNFLANQQRLATMDGVIVAVEIARRGSRWQSRSVRFTPTFVERDTFRILPAAESLDEGWPSASLAASLTASWRRTNSVITNRNPPNLAPTAIP